MTAEVVEGEEAIKQTESEEQRSKRRAAEGAEIGKTLKAGKFRKAFAEYLGAEQAMNEAQFTALVMLFQITLQALWDFLVDPTNLDQPNPARSVPPTPTSVPASSTFKHSTNVWITLVHQSLETLDHSIRTCASPQHQAERIKLKNAVFRLATGLDFLNRESFLIVKGIDSKGQFKLDRFLKKH